jgi:GNAT superfamily N-acetyltransferase
VLSRALAFAWAVEESCADEVIAVAPGVVLRSPSLHGKWAPNVLRIEGDHLSIGVPELAALVAEHFTGREWHTIELADERMAARLDQPLQDAGYELERALVMALDRPPDRLVDTSAVRAASVEELRDLEAAWAAEEEPGEDVGAMLAVWERQHRAKPELRFVIDDEDGRPAAMTLLRWHARTAQVEDVFTRTDMRNRGLARALVTHALAVAHEHGHEHVFILADADDTPQVLYTKLGFTVIGRYLAATREGLPSAA